MIYDCFIFYNELEILKVRLNELSKVVDKFVIIESTKTFQGKNKPLIFAENRHLFAQFEAQIIYRVCDMPESVEGLMTARSTTAAWAREHYQRNFIGTALMDAQPDDLIIISDVDEVIRAAALDKAVQDRRRHELTIFEMPNYTGFFNRKMNGVRWLLGPRMLEFRMFGGAQKVRMTRAFASRSLKGNVFGRLHTRIWNYFNTGIGAPVRVIDDAGWHFSSIGDWKNWRNKVDAFSHEELKDDQTYLREEAFMENLRHNTRPVGLEELPEYIRRNKSEFVFLE